MTKITTSTDRYTFQRDATIRRLTEKGITDTQHPEAIEAHEMYQMLIDDSRSREQDPEWTKNNMEYDLRTSQRLCAKVRDSDSYAQNLYAAMCNRDFQRIPTEDTPESMLQILREELPTWSCSWRHAGGIIADMQEKGDYINWYCSGIAGGDDPDTYEQGHDLNRKKYVSEGVVTEEVEQDLLSIGWRTLPPD